MRPWITAAWHVNVSARLWDMMYTVMKPLKISSTTIWCLHKKVHFSFISRLRRCTCYSRQYETSWTWYYQFTTTTSFCWHLLKSSDNEYILILTGFVNRKHTLLFSMCKWKAMYVCSRTSLFFSLSERELIESLPFNKQCPEDEVEFVKFLYENKLKKVCSNTNFLKSVFKVNLMSNLNSWGHARCHHVSRWEAYKTNRWL